MNKFEQLFNSVLKESLGGMLAFVRKGKTLVAYKNTQPGWDEGKIIIEVLDMVRTQRSILNKLAQEMEAVGISWSWADRPRGAAPAIAIRKTEDLNALGKVIGKKIPQDWH